MPGSKHLIQCHCVLPQYRNLEQPVFHQFVVFSRTDSDGSLVPSLSKCNNCGVIHKIVDFCRSEIAHGIDESLAISSEDDMREFLSEHLSNILDSHFCDTATWEQVTDIVSNKEWGAAVILSRQTVAGATQIKKILINGEDSFKIETNLREEFIG